MHLTDKQARARVAYEEAVARGEDNPITAAAKLLAKRKDGTYETCRKRVWQVIRKLERNGGADVEVIDAESDWTPSEAAKDKRWETRARTLQGKLNAALKELDEANDVRRAAFGLGPAHVKPSRWSALKLDKSGRRETPVLLTSDFQIGEVVRAGDTPSGNEYSIEVFRKRYRRLVERAIALVEEHHGGADHFVYLRGGDTISGGIHEELADTDEVPPPVQARIAIEEESAGIRRLLDAFGKVYVYSVCGNHDRIHPKPRAKRYTDNSYEVLIQYGLEAQFTDPRTGRPDPRVIFRTDSTGDLLFDVRGFLFLLTHGDRIGTGGGQGFIGPVAPITRGVQKVIAQYAGLGVHIDCVLGGHYHTSVETQHCLFNNTLVGDSEYAHAKIRAPIAPPSQTLFFVHDRYGRTATRRIYLNGHQTKRATKNVIR